MALHPQPQLYQMRIRGHLGHQGVTWFEGVTIRLEENGDTLLTGPVVDQAALYGLLKRVRDRGLALVSVTPVEEERSMNIYEAIYTTRSMRRLKPDPIPYAVQARILDAAIRAPHIGEGWRFILVDDQAIKEQLAPLYRQGMERLAGAPIEMLAEQAKSDDMMGRMFRSALYLVEHFAETPLLLVGFGRTAEGSGIYPALQNAMLAARAEGVGATLTGFLQTFFAKEVKELLGVPHDAGWFMHGVIVMGYPLGTWGIGARKPVQEVAARNSWDGALGFSVPEPLWRG